MVILLRLWIMQFRYMWSAYRHRNSPKNTEIDVNMKFKPSKLAEIPTLIGELYARFTYKYDGFTELFDSMDSPLSAFTKMIYGTLYDDCDGFHAGVYWCISHNFDCRLLTVITKNIKDSHTVLVFKSDSKYYFIDYYNLSQGYDTMEDLIIGFDKISFKGKGEFVATELSYWDEKKLRWVSKNKF